MLLDYLVAHFSVLYSLSCDEFIVRGAGTGCEERVDRRAVRMMVLLWYCREKTTDGISSFCILLEARVGEYQVPRCYSVNDGMKDIAACAENGRRNRVLILEQK